MTHPILTPTALEAAAKAAYDYCWNGPHSNPNKPLPWEEAPEEVKQYYRDEAKAGFYAALEQLRREGRITEGNAINPSITIWLLPEDAS